MIKKLTSGEFLNTKLINNSIFSFSLYVAVHDSLFGDPLLGEEQMQRFHASRFNDRGQALDDYGIPCAEIVP